MSESTPKSFSCPHRFARLRLAPHPRWGQKPLMLFSLFFDLYPELQKGAEIVNLKIRDIDPVALKKIDEIAKRKGVSRQKFLKAQIEMLAFFQQQNKREMELENLIEKNIHMMSDCYNAMEKMNEFIQMMMQDVENE